MKANYEIRYRGLTKNVKTLYVLNYDGLNLVDFVAWDNSQFYVDKHVVAVFKNCKLKTIINI